jgi:hypothetical protein
MSAVTLLAGHEAFNPVHVLLLLGIGEGRPIPG